MLCKWMINKIIKITKKVIDFYNIFFDFEIDFFFILFFFIYFILIFFFYIDYENDMWFLFLNK